MFVRTNNHLEGSHSRYSKNLGSATPTFANLVDLLKDESESVMYLVTEIYSGRSGNQQSKAAAARNVELKDIWHKYQAGLIVDVTELLDELTKQLVGPDVHMIAFYADPKMLMTHRNNTVIACSMLNIICILLITMFIWSIKLFFEQFVTVFPFINLLIYHLKNVFTLF